MDPHQPLLIASAAVTGFTSLNIPKIKLMSTHGRETSIKHGVMDATRQDTINHPEIVFSR